jgi:hypothetical protein
MTDLREGDSGLPLGLIQAFDPAPAPQPRRSSLRSVAARLAEAAAIQVDELAYKLLGSNKFRLERWAHEYGPIVNTRRWVQRARRGWAIEDTFSFDEYLARVIVEGLTELRNRDLAHPGGLTMEEWRAVLDEIIIGFKTFLDEEKRFSNDPAVREKMDRGWELFREWFPALWD